MAAGPSDESSGLQTTKPQRRRNIFDQGRDEDAPLGCILGFFLHPARFDRRSRPEDDNASGSPQRFADHLVEHFSGRDRSIPEDSPTPALERFGKGHRPLTILARVAEEDLMLLQRFSAWWNRDLNIELRIH
jgi:hypothetical protein